MIHRITMIGPQGCGKGTQAERLAAVLKIPQIAPGALYRREMVAGTERGRRVAELINRGEMAPNDITHDLIVERLKEPDCANGYILDGFPRDLEQLRLFEATMAPFTHAILLTISDEEAVRRLSDRWVCVCGKPYAGQELVIAAGEEARCVACAGRLMRRPDDEPDAIRRRLQIYHERTEPAAAELRQRGILIEIDGEQPIEKVHRDILAGIGAGS